MPRLKCSFARFIEIIEQHQFAVHRHGSTSHRRYRGEHSGRVWYVDVAYHRINDDIHPDTLNSMIRQCGLSKALFRQ